MSEVRIETDSLGEVHVPADKLWGAQTQRSLEHSSIGQPCSHFFGARRTARGELPSSQSTICRPSALLPSVHPFPSRTRIHELPPLKESTGAT
jgi:hypothetical protein